MQQTEEHDSPNVDPGQGNGAGNSGQGSAPISLDDATVEALLQHPKVAETLSQIAQQSSQKVKDRRIAGLQKDVNDILSQLNLTPEQQATAKNIQQENLINQLTQAVFGQGQNQEGNSQEPPAKGQNAEPVDMVTAFTSAGYNMNSLTVEDIQFAEKFQGSTVDLANALLKRKFGVGGQGQQQAPPVSAGGVMPSSGNVAPALSGNELALQNEYKERLSKIRPGSVDEVASLKAEFRKRGLKNLF